MSRASHTVSVSPAVSALASSRSSAAAPAVPPPTITKSLCAAPAAAHSEASSLAKNMPPRAQMSPAATSGLKARARPSLARRAAASPTAAPGQHPRGPVAPAENQRHRLAVAHDRAPSTTARFMGDRRGECPAGPEMPRKRWGAAASPSAVGKK